MGKMEEHKGLRQRRAWGRKSEPVTPSTCVLTLKLSFGHFWKCQVLPLIPMGIIMSLGRSLSLDVVNRRLRDLPLVLSWHSVVE